MCIHATVPVLARSVQLTGPTAYPSPQPQVIIATPLVEFYGPIVTRVSEFWVMGTCEFEGGAPDLTGGGGGGGETEGTRALSLAYGASVRRQMYNLPRWVAPLNGCQKDVDFFFGKAGGAAGISVGGETEGSRRSLASAKAIVRAAQAKRGGDKKALAARRPAVDRKLLSFFKKGGSTAHLPDQVCVRGRGRVEERGSVYII